ncbi:DUF2889 domain-containing protein [Pseudomonas sp. NFX98]|uniref:DUF2889 domain-containing protein n=1 Tax=Pseudomonas sp. NFX98 TaxID=3399122 RepID=UPI0039FDAD87
MSQDHLNAPTRQLLHTRNVTCTGYLRSDGLFDIEARLLDTKGVDTQLSYGTIPAGGVLHQMVMIMTVNLQLEIQHIEARSEVTPTPLCAEISAAYAKLKGIRIGPGLKKQVAERVGGIQGCTHLTELLGPMATTAVQIVGPIVQKELLERAARDPGFKMPEQKIIGTCHAFQPGGEPARRLTEWRPHVLTGKNVESE